MLSGGGGIFILVVHIGPAAGDAVESIPEQHDSLFAGVIAIIVLVALVVALFAHCFYELRRLLGQRPR